MATTYSYAQLEQLWIQNGGSKAAAPVAAAIALAESSGSAAVTSSNPDGGTNVGLWQLDTPGGVGAGHTVAQLQDPNTNAAVAVQGSANGTNWGDWQTYTQGTYRQYLNGSTTPDPNVPAATLTSAGGSDCLVRPVPPHLLVPAEQVAGACADRRPHDGGRGRGARGGAGADRGVRPQPVGGRGEDRGLQSGRPGG